MRFISKSPNNVILFAALTMSAPAGLLAQTEAAAPEAATTSDITVVGAKGPEVKGFISARKDNKVQVTGADGSKTVVSIDDATKIRASSGLFSSNKSKPTPDSLLNGLPVTIKTVQSDGGLVASQIVYKNNDFKTAAMIRSGTAEGFEQQTAATEALRGRVSDLDQYNVKSTTNVTFDTGKTDLSPQAKQELCAATNTASSMDNALLLVVGYTDTTGSEDYNQVLSEKRAGRVVNYLQQACGWKPYRMLTPTGMSWADPVAPNDTDEGKAMNRRVAVNVMVSKGLDGL